MKRVDIMKGLVGTLAVVLFSAIAFLFIVCGLTYKSVDFIKVYFNLLIGLSAAGCSAAAVAGVLLFLFKKQSAYRLTVCMLIFVDICSAVFFTLCATGLLGKITSVDALREFIELAGGKAAVIYVTFCFLQVVLLPVPGSIAVAVGVAMFGPLKCALYAFVGIILGSIAAFSVGHFIGYKAVCWIVGRETLDKWQKKLKGKDYLILTLMFILPMFPDDVLCFVAGLSSMTWGYFIIMIILTRALSVFSTAYSFELIPFNTWWGITIWIAIAVLIVASFWLVCKYSDRIDKFIKTKFKIRKRGDR